MLNVDGFLAPLLKKVELYDAANPLPLNRIRGAYFGIAAIGRGRSGICQSGIIAETLSGFGSVVLAKSDRMSCGVLEAPGNCASVTDGT